MSRRLLFVAPLILLLLFGGLVAWRLANPPDEVIRSQLEGRKLPPFDLPAIVDGKPGLATADLAKGEPRLLNIFASWCVPCIEEAPLLLELERRGVKIDAIAVRDRSEDVAEFLAQHGDPFARIGSDERSQVQLALGSSGVPESFIVDGNGVIVHQHVGPLQAQDLDDIVARIEAAR